MANIILSVIFLVTSKSKKRQKVKISWRGIHDSTLPFKKLKCLAS